MKRYSLTCALPVFVVGLHAQTANPLSTELRHMYTIVKTNLLKMALQESYAACDDVFNKLTDATAIEKVNGRIGSPPVPEPWTRLSIMWNVVRHSNELYGYMAVYMRLKGIVPPSSEGR